MMGSLSDLLRSNDELLTRKVIAYARDHGYVRYSSTLIEAWRISIVALNQTMLSVLDKKLAIALPDIDDDYRNSEIDRYSAEEARKHRSRGVTLAMFMGLVKYYKRSYFDLVREQDYAQAIERECLGFLETFFDRFEISFCVEWNRLNQQQSSDELQNQNRQLANEKNKYLTIFESLYDPVILLDRENKVENVNQAAVELLMEMHLPAQRYYSADNERHALSWLADEIGVFTSSQEQESVFRKVLPTQRGGRHYQIKMKRMQDISDKYPGTVIVLNDLSDRLEKEEAITRNRLIQRWVNLLIDLSSRISSTAELGGTLQTAIESIRQLIDADEIVLGMWQADRFRLRTSPCPEAGGQERRAIFIPRDLKSACAGEESPLTQRYRLALPMETKGDLLGILWAGREQAEAFSSAERMMLDSVAQLIGFAIEHAKMNARLQSDAIIEERTRLAREMHDGLSQILGFLSLEMQSLKLLVERGKLAETLAEIELARKRIREAQAEVRDNILSLRTSLEKQGAAIELLCDYLRDFSAQTGIEVLIDKPEPFAIDIPPMTEVHLLRIVQEAFANIRQHAGARYVAVRFRIEDKRLCVEIVDDGIGFVATAPKNHYGLKSMRERTQSVGGTLEVQSELRRGTRVRLCLPVQEHDQEMANRDAKPVLSA